MPREADNNRQKQAKSSPDKVEKMLEERADVFADIVNVLIHEGMPVVKPQNLVDGPTTNVFKNEMGVLSE